MSSSSIDARLRRVLAEDGRSKLGFEDEKSRDLLMVELITIGACPLFPS
jgi:hypothetical protein